MKSSNIAKANILIVDDVKTDVTLLSTILKAQGYQVQATNNGTTALELAKTTLPDLIFLGINIPEPNGYEVCRQLKADRKTLGIPVIFISGHDKRLDKVKAFAVGGVNFITKPFQFEEILAHVKTHLTMHQLQKQLESQVATLQTLTNRFQSEMAVARNIQQGLLPPSLPNWSNLDVVCYTQSAREVGGDFYTYYAFDTRLRRSDQRYAIAIGDVSGKGMAAALLMTISLASFKNIVGRAYTLNKLVTDLVTKPYALSKLLTDLDKDIAFYTGTMHQNCGLVYVELTKPVNIKYPITLRAVNAGCIAPIIRRSNGTVAWVDVGGLPLGVGGETHFNYPEQVLTLSKGDMVILSSDGLVEATNNDNKMFGFDRFEQAVATGPQSSAQAMLDHLKAGVNAFVGETEPHDDLTVAIIHV